MDCCQAPLSMGFSRWEYLIGLPFPPPGDLLNPGIELGSPELQADSLPSELLGKPILILGYWILKGGKKKASGLMIHQINHSRANYKRNINGDKQRGD